MTKEEFFAFQKEQFEKRLAIARAKNADYTGGSQDPFANFKAVEVIGACSAEQGFLTRMTDKLARLGSFVKNGTLQVKDESVMDTLQDLANYCDLFAGYLQAKRQEELADLAAKPNRSASFSSDHY